MRNNYFQGTGEKSDWYILESEWHSFRTRQSRDLDFCTDAHTYDRSGCYTEAVEVIDIFGNETMTLVPLKG